MRDEQSKQRVADMLRTALGTEICDALQDPTIIEIMMNPDGRLWLEQQGQGRFDTGIERSIQEVERTIRIVASHNGRNANQRSPIVSAELPLAGERFEGVLPPVSTRPCFSIRKPAGRIFTLDEYVHAGTMSPHSAQVLRDAITERANILIVGGTGSGKTTLANALLAEIANTQDRIVLLEDTRELQCSAEDMLALRTEPGLVTLNDLVRSTLRLRPDRIIIGEVRGGEALAMLKAWNTGHPGGIATLHANSADAGLFRLEQLIGEVTQNVPHHLIAETIDRVVFIRRKDGIRQVETILSVDGITPDGYALEPITTPLKQVST